MKLAIFLPNWIGDVVMATPALRAVRDQYPSAEIIGIMRPYVADVLAGTSLLDRTLFYNPRSKIAEQRGWPFIRQLRSERFDTVLLLTNSLRTGWLGWLSGARRRIGFARDWRGLLLTDRVTPKSKSTPHPVMDEYLRLTERMGCLTPSNRIELAVLPQDQARLDEFWQTEPITDLNGRGEGEVPAEPRAPMEFDRHSRLGGSLALPNAIPRISERSVSAPTLHRQYVCLNTGGAFGAAKNWPKENFAELARRIAMQLKKNVLVVCGPSEREDAKWIAQAANDPAVVSLADVPLSIGLTKAAIRQSDLLVTTDSGPRHFAAAFGTPVITLFGPTHIEWSDTRYEKSEHLQLKLDCGPCQKRDCPLKHHRCMKELSVDAVFAAVQRQLVRHSVVRVA